MPAHPLRYCPTCGRVMRAGEAIKGDFVSAVYFHCAHCDGPHLYPRAEVNVRRPARRCAPRRLIAEPA